MNARLDERHVSDLLGACARAEDDSARQKAASALVTYLWEVDVLSAWSVNLSRRYSAAVDVEEMKQVLAEGILARARKITVGEFEQLQKPSAHLWFACKRAAEAYCDSGAVTLAGHMTGVSRRHRRAQKARQDYVAEFGVEPSAQEVVEWANKRSYQTVENPVKAGVLLTVSDVEGTGVRGHSLDDEAFTGNARVSSPDRSEESATVALTAKQIIVLVAELHEDPKVAHEVAKALDAWIDLVASGEAPTTTALARELGCSQARAVEHNTMIQSVLRAFRERHSRD